MNSLVPHYQEMAARGASFFGLSVLQHETSIRSFAEAMGVKSVLDFGCGRGDAYGAPYFMHRRLGVPDDGLTLYDPAFQELAAPPVGEHDLVICSDVLEHVPKHEVDEFVAVLFSHARRGVWASVCCRLAKKAFDDGRNLHVTVRPFSWWSAKFSEAAKQRPGIEWSLIETP
jgi:hypothetical protein